jgi:hypothetical protein
MLLAWKKTTQKLQNCSLNTISPRMKEGGLYIHIPSWSTVIFSDGKAFHTSATSLEEPIGSLTTRGALVLPRNSSSFITRAFGFWKLRRVVFVQDNAPMHRVMSRFEERTFSMRCFILAVTRSETYWKFMV